MTLKLAEYIEAGKALDPDERLEAAHQLLLSVDHDQYATQSEIDTEWDVEIDRRVNEIMSGAVQLADGRETMANIRAELAAARQ